MAKLGDLVVHIGANTAALNASLGKVQRNMRSMTANFTKLGMSMSRAITLPLALIGGLALRTAVKFEASMAKVKAVSGATAQEFDSLTASAKELGRTTVFTASEVAGLQLEFAKLGFTATQINQVTEATLNLAQATGSDLAQAAEVAGATLGGFGLAASETGRVADVMAASFSSSALDINHFQESMKLVAPNAKAAGVSIEETTAMLAVLSKAGIKGSIAGTALRRILQEMQGTSGTLTERFAELNKAGLDVQGSMDEVGRRAGTSLLVLAEGSGEVQELTGAYINSAGAAKAMADVMNNTTAGAMKRMTSALEGAAFVIGDALAPALSSVAQFITNLSTGFSNLTEKTRNNILVFTGLAAVIGPLLLLIPQLVAGIKLIGLAFTTGAPHVLAATVAISAIALLFIDTSREASTAADNITKVDRALKDLTTTELFREAGMRHGASIERVKEAIKFSEDLAAQAREEMKAIQAAADARGKGFSYDQRQEFTSLRLYAEEHERIAEAASILKKTLEDLEAGGSSGTIVKGKDVKVVTIFANEIDRLLFRLGKMPGAIFLTKDAVNTLSNGVQEFLVNSSTDLLNFLDDFTNVAEEIEIKNEGVKDSFTTLADSINEEIERGVEAMIGGLALMVGAAIGAEKPIEGMGAFMGETLAQMAINIGEYAIAHGTVIEAIKESLMDLNGIGAIIAGAALIALGAGMKSAIQRNAEAAGVPALAEGGLAYGPTLAMVGDNKGANVDPEVVAPLSKLKDLMGGNAIQVYGRISGDDIVISNTRASRDRNRF